MSSLNKLAILLSSGLILAAPLGLAQKKDQEPAQGKPPRDLTQQADGHWSANKQPEKAEGFEVHTVKPGDTLWDVTKQYLKDPYLWPQVWEMNPSVTNPHWIYPGDHLFIKKMVVVNTTSEPAPPSQSEAQEAPAPPAPPKPPTETPGEATPAEAQSATTVPVPAASQSDVYCAGFFSTNDIKPEMTMVGGEESESKSLHSDRDIIYVNKGSSSGIKPGEEFLILRHVRDFGKYGPSFAAARSKYGHYYQDIGRVRVLLAHENSATAEIVFACEEINVNDFLVPNEQRIIPVSHGETTFDKFAPPNNKTAGKIFMTKEFRQLVGNGQIVYIDVGQKQNVQVGDYFRIVRRLNSSNISLFNKSDYRRYRETFESVRKVVGELVVLRVETNTASALVTVSTEEIALGDRLELE